MSKLDVVVPIRDSTTSSDVGYYRTELQKNSQQVDLAFSPSTSPQSSAGMSNHKEGSTRTLILCFAGIFVCYFYYGILQEKITRSDYGFGETKERFTYFFCLVLVQCIINATFAKSVLLFHKQGQDTTSTKLYVLCSLSYLGAMVASNSALKYVSYPFQVLGKSCKPIPVMILGVLLARKRYPLLKYFCVLLIVIGVATFVYKDGKASSSVESAFGFGELLLVLSLTLDGLTGVAQEKMRTQHQTTSHHMMANVNLWSVLYLTITVIITGEGIQFIEFVSRYPYVIWNILTFGAASALGQHFIFVTVTTFGPLTCSIMTTTRKFFTILGSVILFSNPLLPRQWGGVLLVFAGLGLDSVFGKSKSSKAI
ncbi:solute carrier family 35 member B1-like [Asterias rubens]|uniref:solute carrier family 35 member B1-like n=1 Tax=Asterias rubens TaxID=7604 RepID=UPI0014555D6F|nr:solute carrier family 35 member B1-like [Asterias rubens]